MIVKTTGNSPVYGKCLELKNEMAELLFSLEFGPRILSYKLTGGKNVLFEDPDRRISVADKRIAEYYKGRSVWYNYGGSRFWINPETMPETYHPDSDPVDYEWLVNGVMLIQKPQKENGIQLSIKVELADDSARVAVKYLLTNICKQPKQLAIWGLTSMAPGGVAFVDTGELFEDAAPNRSFVFWPYTDIRDKRLYLGKRFVTLKQEPGNPYNPVNMGINAVSYAGYLNAGYLFVKKYDYAAGKSYADLGASFEMYSCEQYAEINSLGSFETVMPNELISHREYWDLTRTRGDFAFDDEASLEIFAAQNIK